MDTHVKHSTYPEIERERERTSIEINEKKFLLNWTEFKREEEEGKEDKREGKK